MAKNRAALDEWVQAIAALYDMIEEWLVLAVAEGLISVTRRHDGMIVEEGYGAYQKEVLALDVCGAKLSLAPVAMCSVACKGRVDFARQWSAFFTHRIPLVRSIGGQWKLLKGSFPGPVDLVPLSIESLEWAFDQLLPDAPRRGIGHKKKDRKKENSGCTFATTPIVLPARRMKS